MNANRKTRQGPELLQDCDARELLLEWLTAYMGPLESISCRLFSTVITRLVWSVAEMDKCFGCNWKAYVLCISILKLGLRGHISNILLLNKFYLHLNSLIKSIQYVHGSYFASLLSPYKTPCKVKRFRLWSFTLAGSFCTFCSVLF